MAEFDRSAIHADLFAGIAAELAAAGFDDAHEVGRGGFGVVYRCEQHALGRTVAVKVLSAVLDDDNYERFLREEYVMGRLSGHPNIATVLQVGSIAGGRPYIVMPYYSHDSLDAQIRREGPCEWEWAVRVGVKLAGAIETAHRSAILHRDVKPANILLTEYGEPQLTDFGIARIAGGFETGTGAVAGSLAFTAPEVLAGAAPTVVSDVYSIGATLFNLIAGHAAFERRPDEEIVAQFLRITTQEIPDLRDTGVPDDVSDVIERAMARDPTARPPTAAALGDELRSIQLQHELTADDMAIPAYASADRAPGAARTDREVPVTQRSANNSGRQRVIESRSRLPVPLTSFVGRRREVRDVEALVGDARLLTLTGPGGVGKTRLALEVAAHLEQAIPGGVWLVELGHVVEPGLLIDTVVDALELGDEPIQAGQPMHALAMRLAESLGARRALIILDNCEHLISECGPLLEVLLHYRPGLTAADHKPTGIRHRG